MGVVENIGGNAVAVPPQVSYYLDLWADWMRQKSNDLGYPEKSAGIEVQHLSCMEDMLEDAEGYAVIVVDRIIEGLPALESAAIHHMHLYSVFRARDLPGAYARAIAAITKGVRAEGWL